MRILAVGDIVGESGVRKLKELTIISFMEIIMSKDILMPASLTDFYTNISCEDIDYCKKNNPNVNFHCDLEV